MLLVVATLGELGVILLFPDLLGPTLLGDSWPGASTVIVPIALAMAARSAAFGARMGLAAIGAGRVLLRWTVVEAVVTVGAGIIGVLVAGAPGAAWGMVVGGATVIVPWWRALQAASSPTASDTEGAALPTVLAAGSPDQAAAADRRAIEGLPAVTPQVD